MAGLHPQVGPAHLAGLHLQLNYTAGCGCRGCVPQSAASSDCTSDTCMLQCLRGSDWLLFAGTAAIAGRRHPWLLCAGDVACMDLGQVPAGRQRSRFLAVGSHDQTVS